MRKSFLALIIFALSSTATYAQFDLGLKLGYNSSISLNSKKEDLKDYSFKKARYEFGDNYHFGIFARYSFNRVFFQPELLYLKQHDKYTLNFKDKDKNDNLDLNMNMFELPTLIGFKIIKSERSSINIYAGPRFSTQLNSSVKETFNEKEPFKKLAKNIEVGFSLGLSIDLRSFIIDARYNINKNIKNADEFVKNLPTDKFIFSIGYKIF